VEASDTRPIFIGSVGQSRSNGMDFYRLHGRSSPLLRTRRSLVSFRTATRWLQQLNAAVLFAATFLMRPLGGSACSATSAERYCAGGCRLTLSVGLPLCFGSVVIIRVDADLCLGSAIRPRPPSSGALGAHAIEGPEPRLAGIRRQAPPISSGVGGPQTHRGLLYSSFQYVTLIGGPLTRDHRGCCLLQKVIFVLLPGRAEVALGLADFHS